MIGKNFKLKKNNNFFLRELAHIFEIQMHFVTGEFVDGSWNILNFLF